MSWAITSCVIPAARKRSSSLGAERRERQHDQRRAAQRRPPAASRSRSAQAPAATTRSAAAKRAAHVDRRRGRRRRPAERRSPRAARRGGSARRRADRAALPLEVRHVAALWDRDAHRVAGCRRRRSSCRGRGAAAAPRAARPGRSWRRRSRPVRRRRVATVNPFSRSDRPCERLLDQKAQQVPPPRAQSQGRARQHAVQLLPDVGRRRMRPGTARSAPRRVDRRAPFILPMTSNRSATPAARIDDSHRESCGEPGHLHDIRDCGIEAIRS